MDATMRIDDDLNTPPGTPTEPRQNYNDHGYTYKYNESHTPSLKSEKQIGDPMDILQSDIKGENNNPSTMFISLYNQRSSTRIGYVLAAAGIGIGLGLLCSHLKLDDNYATWISMPGDLFVAALKCLIGPMVFCSIVGCIGQLVEAGKAASIGGRIMGYFVLCSLVSSGIGVLFGSLFSPFFIQQLKGDESDVVTDVRMHCWNGKVLSMTNVGGLACVKDTNVTELTSILALNDTNAYFATASDTYTNLDVSQQLFSILNEIIPSNMMKAFSNRHRREPPIAAHQPRRPGVPAHDQLGGGADSVRHRVHDRWLDGAVHVLNGPRGERGVSHRGADTGAGDANVRHHGLCAVPDDAGERVQVPAPHHPGASVHLRLLVVHRDAAHDDALRGLDPRGVVRAVALPAAVGRHQQPERQRLLHDAGLRFHGQGRRLRRPADTAAVRTAGAGWRHRVVRRGARAALGARHGHHGVAHRLRHGRAGAGLLAARGRRLAAQPPARRREHHERHDPAAHYRGAVRRDHHHRARARDASFVRFGGLHPNTYITEASEAEPAGCTLVVLPCPALGAAHHGWCSARRFSRALVRIANIASRRKIQTSVVVQRTGTHSLEITISPIKYEVWLPETDTQRILPSQTRQNGWGRERQRKVAIEKRGADSSDRASERTRKQQVRQPSIEQSRAEAEPAPVPALEEARPPPSV
ncbi:hypothetical protein ON010_g10947 [Phytophthora cinnamomi]|nr:hypothetical protein ON010_g10947 [Phytophthora cinnamomi]